MNDVFEETRLRAIAAEERVQDLERTNKRLAAAISEAEARLRGVRRFSPPIIEAHSILKVALEIKP